MRWVSTSERFYGNKPERAVRRAELWAPSLPAPCAYSYVLSFLCFWAGGNSHTHFISDTVGHELWSLSIFLPSSIWHSPYTMTPGWLQTGRVTTINTLFGGAAVLFCQVLYSWMYCWLTGSFSILNMTWQMTISDPSGVVHWTRDDMPDRPVPHGLFHTAQQTRKVWANTGRLFFQNLPIAVHSIKEWNL